MLKNLSYTSKNLIKSVIIISCIGLVIGYFFSGNYYIYVKGVILGTLFSIMKVSLLERTISKSLNMSSKSAQNYVRMHYVLRYILTGFLLAVAATNDSISFIGVVLGLISLQFSAYIVGFFERNNQTKLDK